MSKLFILLTINTIWVGKMQENKIKNGKRNLMENDLGFILWKLESIEDFLPCYKTLMKQDQD
jgi:hypothetical protein